MNKVLMSDDIKLKLQGYTITEKCWWPTEFNHKGKPMPFKSDGKGGYLNAKLIKLASKGAGFMGYDTYILKEY